MTIPFNYFSMAKMRYDIEIYNFFRKSISLFAYKNFHHFFMIINTFVAQINASHSFKLVIDWERFLVYLF